MSNQVPTTASEIELIYKSTIRASKRPQIMSSEKAYDIFKNYWSEQIGLVEEFMIVLLDNSNRALAIYPVSVVGVSSTVVDVRIIFAAALKARASAIILAHNHPSGNLKPSQADLSITKKIREAGKILDIPILDHLILSLDGGYLSFKDEGYF